MHKDKHKKKSLNLIVKKTNVPDIGADCEADKLLQGLDVCEIKAFQCCHRLDDLAYRKK